MWPLDTQDDLLRNVVLCLTDAVVLLDILDGLADHLTSLDTSDQQAMMRQKYTLVRDRVNLYSQKSVLVAVKKQLKEGVLVLL